MWRVAAMLALTAAASAAQARDYCPERPGIGSPPCTLDPGRVAVETAFADWTLEKDATSRTDTILFGDTVVRIGLADRVEAQIGWTPVGHVRERDRTTGRIDHATRVGDASVALKFNLANPDGSGFSAALVPFVTVPIGRAPVGAGDWGTGIRAPLSYELNDIFSLQATPEVDAAVDMDGDGRHLAYGSAAGIGFKLSKAVQGAAEVQFIRDDDPSGHATHGIAGLSFGWMVSDNLQLDAGANAGLNHRSPDAEVYAGISRRF